MYEGSLLVHNQSYAVMQQPDGPVSSMDLARQLADNRLVPPEHQRSNNRWSDSKKRAWINRLREVVGGGIQYPLGVICIYTVAPEGHRTQYLNEGLQRITAIVEALAHPTKYGFAGREDAESVFNGIFLLVQRRVYSSHLLAAKDFGEVNNGTTLHKAEKYKLEYVYSNNWPVWKDALAEWRQEISRSMASFAKGMNTAVAKLDRERSDRHLLAVAFLGRPLNGNEDNSDVELAVADVFKEHSPDEIRAAIMRMQRHMSVIETCWEESQPNRAIQMNERLARWCLGTMFIHYSDYKPQWWSDLFTRLFKETGQDAILSRARAGRSPEQINLTWNFGRLPAVCRALGYEMPDNIRRPRQKGIKPGYDGHHYDKPFCDGGNGPTKPMPAALNRALCAREDHGQ
jgi:hypothetical protein